MQAHYSNFSAIDKEDSCMRRTIVAAVVSAVFSNALKMTSHRGAFILFEGTCCGRF